jgi:hypothetical protein
VGSVRGYVGRSLIVSSRVKTGAVLPHLLAKSAGVLAGDGSARLSIG